MWACTLDQTGFGGLVRIGDWICDWTCEIRRCGTWSYILNSIRAETCFIGLLGSVDRHGSPLGNGLGMRLGTGLGTRLGMRLGTPLGSRLGTRPGTLIGTILRYTVYNESEV